MMTNLVDRASELVGGMRAAIANSGAYAAATDDEADRGSTRRLPASINPGHHPEMHDAPHNTEVVRPCHLVPGRRQYKLQYAGRLKTPLPNLSDTRVFLYIVKPERSSMAAIADGPFYATANGNRVPKGRHWWFKTGRTMIGQEPESRARARAARGQPAARSPLARVSDPPPAPRTSALLDEVRSSTDEIRREAGSCYLSAVDYALQAGAEVPRPPAGLELRFVEAAAASIPESRNPDRLLREVRRAFQLNFVQPPPPDPPPAPQTPAQTDADRSNEFYARARFYARTAQTGVGRQSAASHYLAAVEFALRASVEVPRPPAGLELRFVEAAAALLPATRDPARLLREAQRAFQSNPPPRTLREAQRLFESNPPPRTALSAGAARAVQSSQLPPADAPDAASFGLAPLAAADESEREKLTSCAICMDEEKPRVALFAPCGHLAACLSCYHAACAADARNARTCPICKAEGKPVLMRLA